MRQAASVTARRRGRPKKSEYLTPTQAKAWLAECDYHVSARTVARACDAGKIACTRTPGGYRHILPEALDDFLRLVLDTIETQV